MKIWKLIPWLTLTFIPFLTSAQNCGCYDCNLLSPANSVDTFEFEFTDVLNDDLSDSNQGVCGVEILFEADRIRGMEFVLISPSGQEVTLVGNNLNTQLNTTTINSEWDIIFVRNADPVNPDPGIPGVWSNGANWVLGGLYNGTYQPNTGTLEDFNTGPVNGTWQLVVRNFNPGFTFYDASIINFRIILCDPDGIECCFANGGIISGVQQYNRCIGDSALQFSPQVFLGNNVPDTNLYGYQWIYAQDTVILKYDSIVDFSSYPQGNYQLCGLSYLIEDLDSLPQPDGVLRWDSLDYWLENTDPDYCADLSRQCINILISTPPVPVNISETICRGDTFPVGDSLFAETGTYMVPIPLASGCDSIVELDLTVLEPDTTFLNETICSGETYMVGDSTYDDTGIFITGIPTGDICDSIIQLDLTVLPTKDTSISVAICQGDSLFILDSLITTAGTFVITDNVGSNGCDSTVTANVLVLIPQANIATPDTLSCAQSGVVVDGSASQPSGNISYFWFTPDGNISGAANGPTVNVISPGQYYLRVSMDTLGVFCADEESVIVPADNSSPVANIRVPDTLTCNTISVFLNGLNSSSGPQFTYEWYLLGTGLLPGQTTARISVDEPGIYRLLVHNTNNGCVDSADIEVFQNIQAPVAEAGNQLELNCGSDRDTLDGSASSQGVDFQYFWTGPGFVCCQNTPFPVVENPGWYYLEVLNNRTGCRSMDSVLVSTNFLIPSANAGNPDTLDCSINQLVLGATASAGPNFAYLWTTADGQILSGENTVSPTIDQAGTYVFTVTNTSNFCVNSDSVTIEIDTILPAAFAGLDTALTCRVDTLTLGSSATSIGPFFTYQWFQNGSLLAAPGNDSTFIQINTNGEYVLRVRNTKNNCISSDTVLVQYDTLPPMVDAGTGFEINCTVISDTLHGSGSAAGNGVSFRWSVGQNCFRSDPNQSIVEVDCEGWYFLEVTDLVSGCASIDSVEVTRDANTPIANAGPGDTLNCNVTQVRLQGFAFPSPPVSNVVWSTPDGNIVSGANDVNPFVDQPGTYYIEVTNTVNNCVRSDTVQVFENLDVPIVDAGPDKEINCDTAQVELFGSSSSNGPSYDIQWLDSTGGIIPGANQLSFTTDTAGVFILEITNNRSFCVFTDTVVVNVDTLVPATSAGPDMVIDCDNLTVLLDGSGSQMMGNLNYIWATDTGQIIAGGNTLMPEVNSGGTYYLTIFNRDNFCLGFDSVKVSQDASIPNATAIPQEQLDCKTYTLQLDGTGSAFGPNIEYNWTTADGNIQSGANTLMPTINQPGTYILEVLNTDNNCFSNTSVLVLDTIAPVADAGPDIILDCNDLSSGVFVDAGGSSQGSDYTYEWTTFGGSILSPTDTLFALINGAGLYDIVVTDTVSGCTAEDEMLATIGGAIPVADVGDTQILPCEVDTAFIDGTASSSGPDIAYLWTTRMGNILSGQGTNTLEVDSSGWYVLTVTDNTSGCIAVDSVQINFLPCNPEIFVFDPDTVNCLIDTVRLDASMTDTSDNNFLWTALNGMILEGQTTPFPLVTAGNYRLEVTNRQTTLTSSIDVEVPTDTIQPLAAAVQPSNLTCSDTLTSLDGTGSSIGMNYAYEWSGPGNITFPTDLITETDQGGDYSLLVTDLNNGCKDTAMVMVAYDTLAPSADAGAQVDFPCNTQFVTLDGSNSSQGAQYTYKWSNNVSSITTDVFQPGQYCLTVTDTNNGCTAIDCTDVVPDQNAPVIEAGMDTFLTCRDTLINLSAMVPQGDFNVSWSSLNGCIIGTDTTAQISINCTDTYTLTVTDNSNGCVSTDEVVVSSNTTPPVSEAGPNATLTCGQANIDLDGSGSSIGNSFEYLWTGPAIASGNTSLAPLVNLGGNYFLLVTDTVNGCTALDSVSIGYDTIAPNANAGSDRILTCSVQSLSLDGNASSQGSDYMYAWNTLGGGMINSGDNTLTPTISSGGSFILMVTDTSNNCTATDTAIVMYDTLAPVITLNNQIPYVINCAKDTVALSAANSTPGGLLSFRWSTLSGNIIGNALQERVIADLPGTYFITVEHVSNGCSSRDTVEVSGNFATPSLDLVPPDPITCDSSEVSLQAIISGSLQDYSIVWSTQNGSIVSDTLLDVIQVNRAARYTAMLTDTGNGCATTRSIVVPADTVKPVAVANATTDLDCFNETVQLSGQGSSDDGSNFQYLWSGNTNGIISGSTGLAPVVDAPGWYILRVRDIRNGCIALDSAEVVENAPPITDALMLNQSPRCYGEENGIIQIEDVSGGTPPFLYALNGQPLQGFGEFNNLAPGIYDILIQDAAGCEFDTTIIVEQRIELLIDLGPELTVRLGDSARLEALINIPDNEVDTLIWQPEDYINCPGCFVQQVSPPFSTVFRVTMIDINGCRATDQVEVILDKTRPVYIPSGFSPNQDGINDVFTIYGGAGIVKVDELLIFDRWGTLVFQELDFQPNDVSHGWDGMYQGKLMNDAVFVYQARITFSDGRTEVFSGDVTLAKN